MKIYLKSSFSMKMMKIVHVFTAMNYFPIQEAEKLGFVALTAISGPMQNVQDFPNEQKLMCVNCANKYTDFS